MTYMAAALEFLFGCHHSNLSRVFTIGGRSYRVCCDCGAQFGYSLETMSVGERDSSHPAPCHVLHLKGAH
jgi:hypothetical protein